MSLFRKKKSSDSPSSDAEPRRNARRLNAALRPRSTLLNLIAFLTFVGAATVMLLKAVLTHFFGTIPGLEIAESVFRIALYVVVGVLAFRHVRRSSLRLVLFVLAAAVFIAALILPYVL